VTLDAKTCVCLVKMSLELSQDSANIEEILSNVIVSAMSVEIDRAGLVGVTTNAAAAPSGIFSLSSRNRSNIERRQFIAAAPRAALARECALADGSPGESARRLVAQEGIGIALDSRQCRRTRSDGRRRGTIRRVRWVADRADERPLSGHLIVRLLLGRSRPDDGHRDLTLAVRSSPGYDI
jgi:hypothetical protein